MKMRVLLVVDLQKEFSDNCGNYERILNYVKGNIANRSKYDLVIALKCSNDMESSFVKYNAWKKCLKYVEDLEFNPDVILQKTSYGLLGYNVLSKENTYDIVGFNTDACVMKVALDLFDRRYNFRVLTKYCYSSSGQEWHEIGIKTMKHLMKDAIIV